MTVPFTAVTSRTRPARLPSHTGIEMVRVLPASSLPRLSCTVAAPGVKPSTGLHPSPHVATTRVM